MLLIAAVLHQSATTAQNITNLATTDLTVSTDSAWIKINEWITNPHNTVEVLPTDSNRARFSLYSSNIDPTSSLAAVIWRTGGMLVDNGWIRVLGSGSLQLNRSVFDWNKDKLQPKKDSITYLIVADDVVGGVFALRESENAKMEDAIVYYFGANNLTWYSLHINYITFIQFCFHGNMDRFYGDFRWEGWQTEVRSINSNQTISCYPLLWTKEGKDISLNRKVISVQECWNNYAKVSRSKK